MRATRHSICLVVPKDPGAKSALLWMLGLLSACLLLVSGYVLRGRSDDEVHFSRDIRPILNQNCMHCHGGVRQKNGVSFLFREEALGVGKSGRRTIVPGEPDASELIARVTSSDPETRMPYHAPPLPSQQIALLRRWIKEGAKWEDHWAFVAPKPQPLPAVKRGDWVRRPLDQFILARLEKEGLEPSPEADKSALLRRVSLDLTGLPPTLRGASSISGGLAQLTPMKNRSIACWHRHVTASAGPHCGWIWPATQTPKGTRRIGSVPVFGHIATG